MRFRLVSTTVALGALTALAACAPESASLDQPTLNISATSPAKDRVVGEAPTILRTYMLDAAGKRQEVTGARCTLKSRDIAATTTTPRRLNLPTYAQGARFANRGAPANVAVTCSGDGKSGSGTVIAAPFGVNSNKTTRTNTYAGGTPVTVQTTTFSSQLSSATPWTYGYSIDIVLK